MPPIILHQIKLEKYFYYCTDEAIKSEFFLKIIDELLLRNQYLIELHNSVTTEYYYYWLGWYEK